MTKEQLMAWARGRGWKDDKFGHMRKSIKEKDYRLKLSSVAVRYEVRVTHTGGDKEWLRLRSAYYKDLSIDAEGKLKGMVN